MEKKITLVLFLSLLVCLCCNSLALADTDTKRLDFAFGLFSVEVSADAVIGPNTGNELSDFRYELSAFPNLVHANFSPRTQYADTAQRKLNNYASLMYVLCGENYIETEIKEETLPNGIELRWQLMRGRNRHALWFEAFSEKFGYNICLSGEPDEEQDERMLALMRSFQADPERELDLLQIRQEKSADNSFISSEHGLRIQLDADWNAVTMEGMLIPQTAFILEKGDGQWFIQLLYTNPIRPEDARDLLDGLMQNVRQTDPFGGNPIFSEPYPVTLDGLGGIEAWVADVEAAIFMKNIAFVHEGYGYFGSFMWVKELDDIARPWMDEAMRSMTIPDDIQ